jgi:hypothetical protein
MNQKPRAINSSRLLYLEANLSAKLKNIRKKFVSYLKQKTTYVRFVASVKQNAFDGRHLTYKK